MLFIDEVKNPRKGRRRRQRLSRVPAGEVRPARRSQRRRRRPRRRRRHGRERARTIPCSISASTPNTRPSAAATAKAATARAHEGKSIEVAGAGGHRGLRRGDRRAALRFHRSRAAVPGGAAAARAARGNARFATLHAPGADRARSREPGRREAAAPGTEAAGRCRAGRVSRMPASHTDLAHLGRAAQDRRLSVHHARAESGRGAASAIHAASWSPIFPA